MIIFEIYQYLKVNNSCALGDKNVMIVIVANIYANELYENIQGKLKIFAEKHSIQYTVVLSARFF